MYAQAYQISVARMFISLGLDNNIVVAIWMSRVIIPLMP